MIETRLQFPPAVAANIGHFTGRTWLLPLLLDWYDGAAGERVFLLTGGPGTGKSMILAWLAGAGPLPADPVAAGQLARLRSEAAAVHFCASATRSNSPQAFAGNIAAQLARNVPRFDQALAATRADRVQIDVSLTVGTVKPGGTAIGAVVDVGGLEEEPAFDRAFTEPVKKLYGLGYDRPLLLLVDALDEAETYTGQKKLASLLAGLDDLPDPVRIVATTRNDPRILKYYQGSRAVDLIEDAPPDVDDVRAFALDRLAQVEGLAAGPAAALAGRIAAAAAGNFLYAALVLEELVPRLPDPAGPDLAGYPLPAGLRGLYLDFLNRELGRDEARWDECFKPLLGLVAVARGEGLTRAQLAAMTGRDVAQPLRACKQYLSGELPDGPFTLFHKSFADFLLDDERNIDYHIDAPAMHALIGDYWLQACGGRWEACPDPYALAHALAHLTEAARQAADPLRRDERRAKLARLLGDWGYLEARTVQLGVDSLLADLRPAAAPEMARRDSRPDPGELIKVLERERPTLLGWDGGPRPAFFAQQIHNRAVAIGLPGVADAARSRLKELGLPYLEQLWRAAPAGHEDEAFNSRAGWWIADTVSGIAVTCDGRQAVTAHLDNTLKVWDVATGQRIRVLRGHEAPVLAVALTPDGRQAVSGSQDGTVKVWDLATGRTRHTLAGHRGTPFAVRLTPDGRRAVSRADDGLVKVWDLDSGQELYSLGVPEDPAYFTFYLEEDSMADEIPELTYGIREHVLAVTADGCRAISASRDIMTPQSLKAAGRRSAGLPGDVVKVWDLEKGHEIYSLRGHRGPVLSVALSPDGQWAVSASEDKTARIWDLRTGRLARTLRGHSDRVEAVTVTPDGRLVVSASLEGTVKVWDLRAGELLRTLTGGEELHVLALAGNGSRVIAAGFAGSVTVWDLNTGRELASAFLEGATPQIAMHEQSKVILAGMSDGKVHCLRYVEPGGPVKAEDERQPNCARPPEAGG